MNTPTNDAPNFMFYCQADNIAGAFIASAPLQYKQSAYFPSTSLYRNEMKIFFFFFSFQLKKIEKKKNEIQAKMAKTKNMFVGARKGIEII